MSLKLVHSARAAAPRQAATAEGELSALSPRELVQLRLDLAAALETVELGSPASRLIGGLARAARIEERRRRHPGGTPRAA